MPAPKANRVFKVCSKPIFVIRLANEYVNTVIILLGVFNRMWEELVFCICLLRGAALCKKRSHMRSVSGICNYILIKDIHLIAKTTSQRA